MRNAQLENENRSLKYRAERAEKERERLMIMMGEKKIAEHGPDPKLVEAALKKSGKLPQSRKPDPDALVSIDRRRVLKQLNALLRQAPGEETYEILSMVGIRRGAILTDVQIGHYRNASLLNSLHCKELEVFCDRGKDTVELRCKKGFLSVTRQPGKRIPLDEAGFSIFLKEVGLKRWLERAVIPVEVSKGGRLTWKHGP